MGNEIWFIRKSWNFRRRNREPKLDERSDFVAPIFVLLSVNCIMGQLRYVKYLPKMETALPNMVILGYMWFVGLSMTSVSNSSAIYQCASFFVFIFSFLCLNEKVRTQAVLFLATSFESSFWWRNYLIIYLLIVYYFLNRQTYQKRWQC